MMPLDRVDDKFVFAQLAHQACADKCVGAIEFVQNKLIEAKKERAAVLLISEDLDEVLSLSDWVAPIYEGEFMGVIPGKEAEKDSVGAMMAGSRLEEVVA